MSKNEAESDKFPGVFEGQEIRRSYDSEGVAWICARDMGRALDYPSDGGNLSRNFRHVSEWREAFDLGTDYVQDERGRIWLSPHGVLQTLRMIVAVERQDRADAAEELLRRWWRNIRRARAA